MTAIVALALLLALLTAPASPPAPSPPAPLARRLGDARATMEQPVLVTCDTRTLDMDAG